MKLVDEYNKSFRIKCISIDDMNGKLADLSVEVYKDDKFHAKGIIRTYFAHEIELDSDKFIISDHILSKDKKYLIPGLSDLGMKSVK